MNLLNRLFGKKDKTEPSTQPEQKQDMPREQILASSSEVKDEHAKEWPIIKEAEETIAGKETSGSPFLEKRSIRVFVSSTFRDMIEDRNELMTHCWPALRKLCADKPVELTEVD